MSHQRTVTSHNNNYKPAYSTFSTQSLVCLSLEGNDHGYSDWDSITDDLLVVTEKAYRSEVVSADLRN